MAERGLVFEIQHFAIHDGPGIRTTVFLKGCPLRCLWCHNPEGQAPGPEILFSPEKCIACRYCEHACPQNAHRFSPAGEAGALRHTYLRSACTSCGKCTLECYSGALELAGREASTDEALAEVLKDRPFYASSGGGLTLSGGEPMQQFAFTRALLREAQTAGLHTVIETSGASTTARYLEVLPYIDLFYFDIKETDPERHRAFTGMDNKQILANLQAIDDAGAAVVLRCPVIPGLNDRPAHFAAVARLAEHLHGAQAVHILPYHALGTHKNQRLGKPQALDPPERPSSAQVDGWVQSVQQATRVPVMRD